MKSVFFFGFIAFLVGLVSGVAAGGVSSYVLSASFPHADSVKTPSTEADGSLVLFFSRDGVVSKIFKTEGDRINKGDTIALLDGSALSLHLKSENEDIRSNQLKLSDFQNQLEALKEESSPQESTSTARTSLVASLSDASTSASNVLSKTDPLFSDPTSESPEALFEADPSIIESIQSGRIQANNSLSDIEKVVSSISSTTDLKAPSTEIKEDLAEIKLFVDTASVVIDESSSSTPTSLVSAWQINLAAARARTDSAISAILSADGEFSEAQDPLAQSKELIAEIAAKKDNIAADSLEIKSLQASLSQSSLIASSSGVITKETMEIGSTVGAFQGIVWIESSSSVAVE